MTNHDDAGFGCAAFGHLASAYVDGELPRAEMDRYATHLPGCVPCQRLVSQYRAIDIAAMPAYPRPSEADWTSAWDGVMASVREDRVQAAASPVAGLLRFRQRLDGRSRWLVPLAAAAAAAALIGLSLSLRQSWAPAGAPAGVATHRPAPPSVVLASAAAEVLSVSCQEGWEPVVWTLGGDDPMTVVQCQPLEA